MDAVQNVARTANTPTGQVRGRHLATLLTALTVLTLGLLGLVAGTASASTTSSASSTTKFTSAVAGTVTATGPTTFNLSGSGVASGLGQVTYTGTVTITPGVVPLTDVLVETLTAKNGDSITLRCEQSAVPVGDTGLLRGTDRWTVVGGTGRYATAKGSGTGTTLIYNLSRFAKTATGTITVR